MSYKNKVSADDLAAILASREPIEKKTKIGVGDGLSLVCLPSGARTWVYRFQSQNQEFELTLGRYQEMTLAKARQMCREAKSRKDKGINPAQAKTAPKREAAALQRQAEAEEAARQAEAAALREQEFDRLAWAWLDDWAQDGNQGRAGKAGNSVVNQRRYVGYCVQAFGRTPISKINLRHCDDALEYITGEHGRETAKRCHKIMVAIWAAARRKMLVESVVPRDCEDGLKAHQGKNHPAIIEPAQFVQLMIDLQRLQNPHVRDALNILARTGARPGELVCMRWSEVDMKGGVWSYIQPKTQNPHSVPLPRQVMAILERRRGEVDGDFVFPGVVKTNDVPGTLGKHILQRALRGLGYEGRHTPHGFRASIRSILVSVRSLEAHAVHAERQIGHSSRESLGSSYDRADYLEDRIEIMQRFCDWLDQAMAGDANVIPLRRFA